jgi:hypothetical protein
MGRGDNLFQFGAFRLDAGERVLLRDGRLVPLPVLINGAIERGTAEIKHAKAAERKRESRVQRRKQP